LDRFFAARLAASAVSARTLSASRRNVATLHFDWKFCSLLFSFLLVTTSVMSSVSLLERVFTESVCPQDVHITAFANQTPGFTAAVKELWSDFCVNEIAEDGTVVRLTSLALPEGEEPPASDADIAPPPAKRVAVQTDSGVVAVPAATQPADTRPALPTELPPEFASILPQSDIALVNEWLAAGYAPRSRLDLSPCDDKDLRTVVHRAVAALLPFLDTSTVDGAVRLSWRRQGQSRQGTRGGRQNRGPSWPRDRPTFTQFALLKEGRDTTDVLRDLARELHTSSARLAVAGTKDKRGVTTQRVTMRFARPGALLAAVAAINARTHRMPPSLLIGNFEFVEDSLGLGALAGNRFSLILRDARPKDAPDAPPTEPPSVEFRQHVQAAVDAFALSGFINFFGLQRFGVGAPPTHQVGAFMLRQDWVGAIKLLMAPGLRDPPQLAAAKAAFLERGPTSALDALGSCCHPFARQLRDIIAALARREESCGRLRDGDYVEGLQALPRRVRSMFVHAYQSYVFNAAAAARSGLGLGAALEGDLVRDASAPLGARQLTAEEAAATPIGHVVLPLVGPRAALPGGAVGTLITELLAQDGMPAPLPSRPKELTAIGDYRPLVVMPGDVRATLIQHKEPRAVLVQSDRERLLDIPAPDEVDGAYLSVRLDFSLPSSAYATVAVRELLKQETGRRDVEHLVRMPHHPAEPEAGAEPEDEEPEDELLED
jgi:tRNA pseudouridine13 synthase